MPKHIDLWRESPSKATTKDYPQQRSLATSKCHGAAPEHPPMPPHLPNRAATREDFLKAALESIAYQLARRRRFPQSASDEQAVLNIMSWDEVDFPRFQRS